MQLRHVRSPAAVLLTVLPFVDCTANIILFPNKPHLPNSDGEDKRLTTIPRGIKLGAVGQGAGVVHSDLLALLGLGATPCNIHESD